jgi:hypothetical protein
MKNVAGFHSVDFGFFVALFAPRRKGLGIMDSQNDRLVTEGSCVAYVAIGINRTIRGTAGYALVSVGARSARRGRLRPNIVRYTAPLVPGNARLRHVVKLKEIVAKWHEQVVKCGEDGM